jgi:hypothetical protein
VGLTVADYNQVSALSASMKNKIAASETPNVRVLPVCFMGTHPLAFCVRKKASIGGV